MLIEPIASHPDIPSVGRQVKVLRVDRIDYQASEAAILIQVDHLQEDGTLHPYLGSFSAFMVSTNAKLVDKTGAVVDAGTPGAVGEFSWLYATIEAGFPLHKLIRSMIQRNAKRGNFDTGNFRN